MFKITLIFPILTGSAAADVIDYTRQDYVLIENRHVSIYEEYGDIFYINNLSYFENIITEEKRNFYSSPQWQG